MDQLPPAPCRVQIIKTDKPYTWYANRVGEEFDTDLAGDKYDYIVWQDYITGAKVWRHIRKEDCIRVPVKEKEG